MHYQAVVVADHELPEGVDRVLVERQEQDPLWIVKASSAPAAFMWNEGKPRLATTDDGLAELERVRRPEH